MSPLEELEKLAFPIATDAMKEAGFEAEANWVLEMVRRERTRLKFVAERDERIVREAMDGECRQFPRGIQDSLRDSLSLWLREAPPLIVGLSVRFRFDRSRHAILVVMSVQAYDRRHQGESNLLADAISSRGSGRLAFQTAYQHLIQNFGGWERAPGWEPGLVR